ncbi:MAG: hypothetical protein M3R00_06685, partial [Pseudomonadota bacterium]|nr:hypothetical protein [Pseudomonadota bacterium]
MRNSRSSTTSSVEHEVGSPEYCLEVYAKCVTQIFRNLSMLQSILQDESASADRTMDMAGLGELLLAIDSHLVRDLVTGGDKATLCDQVIAQSEIISACQSARPEMLKLPDTIHKQPMESFNKMSDINGSYIMQSAILPDRDNAGLKDKRTEFPLSQIATTPSDQRLFLEQNTYYTPTRNRLYAEANSSIRKNFQSGLSELLRELKKSDAEIVHVEKLEKEIQIQRAQVKQRYAGEMKSLRERNKGQENTYLASELRYRDKRAMRMEIPKITLRYNFNNPQSYLYWT